MRTVVPLYSEDRDLATRIAEGRNRKERSKGAMTYTGRHSFEVHLEGALAEVAVAKHYGAKPDERIFEDGGDEGDDLYIGGHAVQVKTTSYREKPLLRVEVHRPLSAEFYFLVVLDPVGRYAEIVGWASRDEVCSAPLERFGKALHENYVLHEDELHRCRTKEGVAAID